MKPTFIYLTLASISNQCFQSLEVKLLLGQRVDHLNLANTISTNKTKIMSIHVLPDSNP